MNDERPIEKLLRRYAKKRRDETGAPPALHPATRRLLQGEVARQFPKSSPEEKKASAIDFFALLTRRWIYAVGLLVVLGVTAVMLLSPSFNKSNGPAMLAQKETEEVALRETVAPAAAPAPALPPAELQPTLAVAENRPNEPAPKPSAGGYSYRLRDESAALSYAATNAAAAAGSPARFANAKTDSDSLRKAESAKQVSLGVSLDSATPATRALSIQPPARPAERATPADSLSLAGGTKAGRNDVGTATDRFNESRQAATPPPVATAAPATVSTGSQDKNFFARGGGVEKDAERSYSQSFANVAPEQLRAKAAKVKAETPVVRVLANFQVQNVGNELRVIDSDGSTYRGVVSSVTAGEAGIVSAKEAAANYGSVNLKRTQVLADAETAKLQTTQSYLWRVEGTNVTLNQNVVFTWNFVNASNAVAATELKAISGALNQDAAKLPSQFPMMLQNSIINGRAQLGPARQIEVNAVPVKQ